MKHFYLLFIGLLFKEVYNHFYQEFTSMLKYFSLKNVNYGPISGLLKIMFNIKYFQWK